MIEKLNHLKIRLHELRRSPAFALLKSSGLGGALDDVEQLVEQLVTDVIDQGNRLSYLESVVDELVVEQGEPCGGVV